MIRLRLLDRLRFQIVMRTMGLVRVDATTTRPMTDAEAQAFDHVFDKFSEAFDMLEDAFRKFTP